MSKDSTSSPSIGERSPPHPGYACFHKHPPAAFAILLADVPRRRPAPAAVEPDQFHTELVEITVAGRIGLLDLDPEFIEGHALAHERALHLDVPSGVQVVDQLDAPLRPIVAEMDLERACAEHVAQCEQQVIVDDGQAAAEMA